MRACPGRFSARPIRPAPDAVTDRSGPNQPRAALIERFRNMERAGGVLIVPLLTAALLLSGCGGKQATRPPDPFQVRQIPSSLQSDLQPVVDGNTAFAFDLYGRLRPQTGNLFLSPYSISTAFAMTWAGARGITESEMAKVLHFPFGQDQLHPVFGAVQRSLERGASLGGYELRIADRLWGEKGYPWLDAFLAVTRDDYEAELQPMSFDSDPEGCRQTINQWIGTVTAGRIPDLLPAGSIDPTTRLVLTNAIYFQGTWAVLFDPSDTRSEAFHTASGSAVVVPMMHLHSRFGYAEANGAQVLEMPYSGGDLSMVFLLPDSGRSLDALENNLTAQNLTAWLGSLRPLDLDVAIPRFDFSSAFSLPGVLSALGMPSAFDPSSADFLGMDGGTGGASDLYITGAFHQASVHVDEKGSVAAGSTGIIIGPTSAGASFTADHPFVFLIHDEVTGSVLFLGRVVDPSQ